MVSALPSASPLATGSKGKVFDPRLSTKCKLGKDQTVTSLRPIEYLPRVDPERRITETFRVELKRGKRSFSFLETP